MRLSFSTREAAQIMKEHQELLSGLGNFAFLEGRMELDVKLAVEELQNNMALEQLSTVPVEEINKSGINVRTKALRDYYYRNIADLCRASEKELEAVKGISAEGASRIKTLVASLKEQTIKVLHFRLSYDERTPETTRIVVIADQLLRLRSFYAAGQSLYQLYQAPINDALQDLQPAGQFFSRLFLSGNKKKQAQQAYLYLTELLSSPSYGISARSLLDRLKQTTELSSEEAWNDFLSDSISINSLIDELLPGALGGDIWYGLPEEMAESIRAQEADLTGLKCSLRRYQEIGVKYILHQKHVLLGDEMGLGKTIQAIASMVVLRNAGYRHFLVICPAALVTNWCREIARFSDLDPCRIHGETRLAEIHHWQVGGGVAVTSYETLSFLLQETNRSPKLTFCIVDEAHYIKNPQTLRSVCTRHLCGLSDYLLFLTGTALENKVEEMLSLLEILQPDIAEEAGNLACLGDVSRFHELLIPVYYRRKRADVLPELPELIEHQAWCTLGPEELLAYRKSLAEGNPALIRQVSWNVDYWQQSTKALRLLDIVAKAKEEGRKVLLFSFFLNTIDKCCRLLGEEAMPAITGQLSPDRRQQIIDDFDRAPAGMVLPAQIQAGGTGLNIQSASVIIICEPQLKPSVERQAIARAYRMGQARSVLVYHLLAEDTIDERIMEVLEKKQQIFDTYADISAAAEGMEASDLSEKSFAELIKEEERRF